MGADADRIAQLEAEARYARQRADLYRAKTYGPRPTSPARMRELERAAEGAEERLRRARELRPRRSGYEVRGPIAHREEENRMAGDDSKQGPEQPSEQRGGTTPGESEAREKGAWAETSAEGVVPADLGGSDMKDDALGRTTGSSEPATDAGIDPAAGDAADATTDGGPEPPDTGDVDTKDVAQAAIRRERDD